MKEKEQLVKTEAKIQSDVFLYFWNNRPETRRLLFHIPNGGKRGIREATKFKAMGVVPGTPDMFLAAARGIHNGLFIEFKRKGEKVKAGSDQEKSKQALIISGYQVVEFDNPEDAIEYIEQYLNI